MASTCDIYKGSTKLGSGTCSDGSASVTSYTAFNAGLSGDIARVCVGRRVNVVVTQVGTHAGKSWNTRVISEGATTVLRNVCPYIGA